MRGGDELRGKNQKWLRKVRGRRWKHCGRNVKKEKQKNG
jgi:hypothetical protein